MLPIVLVLALQSSPSRLPVISAVAAHLAADTSITAIVVPAADSLHRRSLAVEVGASVANDGALAFLRRRTGRPIRVTVAEPQIRGDRAIVWVDAVPTIAFPRPTVARHQLVVVRRGGSWVVTADSVIAIS